MIGKSRWLIAGAALVAVAGLGVAVSASAANEGQPELAARAGAPPVPLDGQFEDFELRFDVLCENGCAGGVVLDPVDANAAPIVIGLAAGDEKAALAGRDAAGRFTVKDYLPAGPSPFAGGAISPRFGARPTPPPPPPPPPAAGATAPQSAPPRGPAAKPLPDGWHAVLLKRRNGILSMRIDGKSAAPLGWIVPDDTGQVRFALQAAPGKPLRYRGVSFTDLVLEPALPEERVASRFVRLHPGDMFVTEAVATGDINRDGVPDIVAGPNVWFGPNYQQVLHVYPNRPTGPVSYANSMLNYVADFDGDGWEDILEIGLPRQAGTLFINPRGVSRHWAHHDVLPSVATEIAMFGDVDGDGKPELVFGRPAGKGFGTQIGYAKPDPANPTAPWPFVPISTEGNWSAHGLGLGDLNGDGKADVVGGNGWWQAPAEPGGAWIEHKADLGAGASIFVDDLDGDGLADIVSSLDAHGYGLAWFKGGRDAQGVPTFTRHMIMGDEQNPVSPVLFTELHALGYADIDGDGLNDIVTGKRWWSHLDSELNPDPLGVPVLYWFRQVRDAGGTHFVPEMIHNRSGVGTQLVVTDLDGDGRPDIATSGRRGTFVFFNRGDPDKAPAP